MSNALGQQTSLLSKALTISLTILVVAVKVLCWEQHLCYYAHLFDQFLIIITLNAFFIKRAGRKK